MNFKDELKKNNLRIFLMKLGKVYDKKNEELNEAYDQRISKHVYLKH